ncbi:MAG: hypothetical protein QM820_55110 [Minicystis sp.]
MRAALISCFLLVLAASCGGKVAVDLTPAGAGGSGAGGSGAGANGGAASSECGVNGMPVPPQYKGCDTDQDCTIKLLLLDCCGALAMVGVAVDESQPFSVYKHACNHIMATCDCDPGPAHTDDGATTDDANALHVTCDDGQCSTHAN